MANVYGLLRVKNEARWIERVIRSIKPVCSEIIVLDDHSTDDTFQICRRLGCSVMDSEFEGINEGRDRTHLIRSAMVSDGIYCGALWRRRPAAQYGDYCLMIDGDEILDPAGIPAIQSSIETGLWCASLHVAYLWDSEEQIRVDRWYKEFRRPSLFCLLPGCLDFRITASGCGFHCSSAPAALLAECRPIDAMLWHMGYLHREDRIRKYEFYNRFDPSNDLEDRYRHMVIGDVFPADSRFKHAGPLELQKIKKITV